jgi:hypothetical protein
MPVTGLPYLAEAWADGTHGGRVDEDRAVLAWGDDQLGSAPAIDEVDDCRGLSGRVVAAAEDWGLGWLAIS